ncbi:MULTISPECIES: hypothetical protein [Burkholderia cepacia complex]|nr:MULTISPECIES: hypothetical protein [Burkholderia cepacia complex]POZ80295.1 hypothetical protein C3743_39475 [Burkholderia contaminans]
MSLLSFVKFPYRMPDGFLHTEDYDTKQIFPSEFRMRFCVVTKEGRLICSEDGDLQYDGSIAISNVERVYLLDFEAGELKRVGCFDEDGEVSKHDFDASNYRESDAAKA